MAGNVMNLVESDYDVDFTYELQMIITEMFIETTTTSVWTNSQDALELLGAPTSPLPNSFRVWAATVLRQPTMLAHCLPPETWYMAAIVALLTTTNT
ncbi:MAG: hypothetical protein R2798_12610 [Chitinophagales bacterium]